MNRDSPGAPSKKQGFVAIFFRNFPKTELTKIVTGNIKWPIMMKSCEFLSEPDDVVNYYFDVSFDEMNWLTSHLVLNFVLSLYQVRERNREGLRSFNPRQ